MTNLLQTQRNILKVDVQEKDVDGMQVFVWNDKKRR